MACYIGRGRGILRCDPAVSPKPTAPTVGSPTSGTPRRQSWCSISPEPTSPTESCSYCNRVEQQVLCRACGYCFRGRVRLPCKDHPEVIHLMDCEVCPNCRAGSLKEFSLASPIRSPPVPRAKSRVAGMAKSPPRCRLGSQLASESDSRSANHEEF